MHDRVLGLEVTQGCPLLVGEAADAIVGEADVVLDPL